MGSVSASVKKHDRASQTLHSRRYRKRRVWQLLLTGCHDDELGDTSIKSLGSLVGTVGGVTNQLPDTLQLPALKA